MKRIPVKIEDYFLAADEYYSTSQQQTIWIFKRLLKISDFPSHVLSNIFKAWIFISCDSCVTTAVNDSVKSFVTLTSSNLWFVVKIKLRFSENHSLFFCSRFASSIGI